ncbi:MAG TPA: pyruvate kinase [Sneathiellales bacterium]|nr:pyruvate kinase [Sneathiellales bacterium]
MRRNRNVKIIATLGPASSSPDVIKGLFEAGADVFRLNMSHGQHEHIEALHGAIRRLEKEMNRPIGIMIDLQGPKLRVGSFKNGEVELETGASFRLDLEELPGDETRASLPHPEVFAALENGTTLLLDDGRIRLRVENAHPEFAETTVEVGGTLSDRKGVNVPDVVLPLAAMTAKDRDDLEFGAKLGVDWVALSFVQRPEDIIEARKLIAGRAAVMAKIEKPAALASDIIDTSDAVMVARGDLGVELPVEDVPGIQKRLIRAARKAGKPVVVATQMLESMINAPVPTRAEVSDVATAVFDGTDAVMLSAETAAGKYPIEAVELMNRVAVKTESSEPYHLARDAQRVRAEATTADAISAAARQIAATLHPAAIVSYTNSGSTGLRAARERPEIPILALTPQLNTARRLALGWGLHCVLTDDATGFSDMVERACRIAREEEFADPGSIILITAGVPFGKPGTTNVLRIARVGEDG